MGKLNRRDVLKLGALGTAAGFGFPAIIRAQSKEIVMLGIWPNTGAFSDVGPILDRGMKMALEERNMSVLGRPIKYIVRDSATQAGTATRRVEEAVDGEGAKFVIGPWSSGVALAVSEVAKRKKVLHIFSGGTEDISGARCHRYSFQWAASPYTAAKTVVDSFMKANPKAKRWHLLVADYAFGLDAVTGAREIFNFGLTPKVPLILTWASGVEELVQLNPEIRENMWVGSNFYYTADTLVAREFVKSYQAKFSSPPGYAPAAAYGMTRMMMHAMDKAKSTEVPDVIKALEGLEVDDLVGRMKVDPKTHQTLRPYFFMRCKKKDAMKNPTDFADIIATGSTPLPAEYAACKDIGAL